VVSDGRADHAASHDQNAHLSLRLMFDGPHRLQTTAKCPVRSIGARCMTIPPARWT
jgi:hypothetical protein